MKELSMKDIEIEMAQMRAIRAQEELHKAYEKINRLKELTPDEYLNILKNSQRNK